MGYLLTGDEGLADRVHELALANLEDKWNELLWGAPGSLLAVEAMLAWTGDGRWARAWDALADTVETARDADGLWTQRLGTEVARYLGPADFGRFALVVGVAGMLTSMAQGGGSTALVVIAAEDPDRAR